jgi:hypothetical protein
MKMTLPVVPLQSLRHSTPKPPPSKTEGGAPPPHYFPMICSSGILPSHAAVKRKERKPPGHPPVGADLVEHGVLPQVITRTVGILGGTTWYSVPGTTVELGGRLRWATMAERYTAVAVKDLPAFKSAFGVLEDVLDGKLLLDGATYISMEISCAMN